MSSTAQLQRQVSARKGRGHTIAPKTHMAPLPSSYFRKKQLWLKVTFSSSVLRWKSIYMCIRMHAGTCVHVRIDVCDETLKNNNNQTNQTTKTHPRIARNCPQLLWSMEQWGRLTNLWKQTVQNMHLKDASKIAPCLKQSQKSLGKNQRYLRVCFSPLSLNYHPLNFLLFHGRAQGTATWLHSLLESDFLIKIQKFPKTQVMKCRNGRSAPIMEFLFSSSTYTPSTPPPPHSESPHFWEQESGQQRSWSPGTQRRFQLLWEAGPTASSPKPNKRWHLQEENDNPHTHRWPIHTPPPRGFWGVPKYGTFAFYSSAAANWRGCLGILLQPLALRSDTGPEKMMLVLAVGGLEGSRGLG